MVKIIKSVTKSIGRGIKDDPEIKKITSRFPRFFKFIKKRLTPSEQYGLYLTIGTIITFLFIYFFFGIIQDLIGQERLIQADLRIINLVSQLRNPGTNKIMLFITYLAKGEVVTVGVITISIIFILLRNWRYLSTLLISILGGELFIWIVKNIIDRPRPSLNNALVYESTYSFPSGHTFVAIAFYGLLVFFILHSEKKKNLKVISFLIGLTLISWIGISRIYLGAHWPSDVLASFASGIAWLTIIITSTKFKHKIKPLIKTHKFKEKTIIKISFLLISAWFIFIYAFFIKHPIKNENVNSLLIQKTIIEPEEITQRLFEKLPKISESMSGLPAEPINIIVVSNRNLLDKAFADSGWYLLDGPSIKSYTKIITSLLTKSAYPETPGLPVFWDTLPNEIGYGQPTSPTSISSRHHIHFWETNFVTSDNQSIWVGTAHFDEEIKKKFKIILPFHTTQLLVDDERENIKNDLEENNFIKSVEKINLTGLLYGTKKSGNNFLTDGQSYILFLKDEE